METRPLRFSMPDATRQRLRTLDGCVEVMTRREKPYLDGYWPLLSLREAWDLGAETSTGG